LATDRAGTGRIRSGDARGLGKGLTRDCSKCGAVFVVEAADDPSLAERTWVLLTEAPDGGWGLAGHANTNGELVAAARAQIAELQARKPDG
jgi:hypothetical protein